LNYIENILRKVPAEMKKLAVIGSAGKMGQKLIELSQSPEWKNKFQVAAQIDVGTKASEIPAADVLVDFSNTASTLSWIDWVAEKKIPYLICTTGFSASDFETIKSKLKNQPWALIPNTSVGVYAFIKCLVGLVRFFGDIQAIEIHEVHHVHKKDSPSGTALLIKAALENAMDRKKIEVKVKSGREGEIVGIHTVLLQRPFDRLILTHEAQDRKLFAEGALALAEKLATKTAREKPYTFDELL
jgi:4-hydroxy-tetrahydrodipicolinate reductase